MMLEMKKLINQAILGFKVNYSMLHTKLYIHSVYTILKCEEQFFGNI